MHEKGLLGQNSVRKNPNLATRRPRVVIYLLMALEVEKAAIDRLAFERDLQDRLTFERDLQDRLSLTSRWKSDIVSSRKQVTAHLHLLLSELNKRFSRDLLHR